MEGAEDLGVLEHCAERLSAAAENLRQVLGKVEAQYEGLNQKIDRIIAAVEQSEFRASADEQETSGRKTISPLVGVLLAKGGLDVGQRVEAGAMEGALRMLSVEQRIAVKAELARAGLLA